MLEFGSVAWSGWRAGELLGRRLSALGDADLDGYDDIVVGTELDSTLGPDSGALYRVSGSPGGAISSATALLPNVVGHQFGAGLDTGVDVTGDGVADILVSAHGTAASRGAAWLVDTAAWVDAGTATVGDVAVGMVEGSLPGSYGPSAARFVGDVDGDGIGDIALGECCGTSAGLGTRGRVAIVSQAAFTGSIEDADILVTGPWDEGFFGYELDAIGDIDDDGLADVLVTGSGGIVGAVVNANRTADYADAVITAFYGEVTGESGRILNVGDLDGDGKDDVGITGESDGVSFFTALAGFRDRGLDAPSFRFVWSESGGSNTLLPLGDLDGDGRGEVLIPQHFSTSGTQRLWVLEGSDVHYGDTLGAADVLLAGVSLVPRVAYGYSAILAGDVDGDGKDDIALAAPAHSLGGELAGGVSLIPMPR